VALLAEAEKLAAPVLVLVRDVHLQKVLAKRYNVRRKEMLKRQNVESV